MVGEFVAPILYPRLEILKKGLCAVPAEVLAFDEHNVAKRAFLPKLAPCIDVPEVSRLLGKVIDFPTALGRQDDAPAVFDTMRGRDLRVNVLSRIQRLSCHGPLLRLADAKRNGVHAAISEEFFVVREPLYIIMANERDRRFVQRLNPVINSRDPITRQLGQLQYPTVHSATAQTCNADANFVHGSISFNSVFTMDST